MVWIQTGLDIKSVIKPNIQYDAAVKDEKEDTNKPDRLFSQHSINIFVC